MPGHDGLELTVSPPSCPRHIYGHSHLSCPALCRASTSSLTIFKTGKTWMAGTSPAMTKGFMPGHDEWRLTVSPSSCPRHIYEDSHLSCPALCRASTSFFAQRHQLFLSECIEQIPPLGVLPVDQPHLPRTRPVLDRLLTLDRGANIVMLFKIDELLQVILLRKTAYQTVAMFMAAPDEVAGDADVKRTIAAVSHYVNKAATHHTNQHQPRRGWPGSRACTTSAK